MAIQQQTYIPVLLFMLVIDASLLFRLIRSEGYQSSEWWIASLMGVGIATSCADLLCVLLQGIALHGLLYWLNGLYHICFTLEMTILLENAQRMCLPPGRLDSPVFRLLRFLPLAMVGILALISFWTGWIFYIDAGGIYVRGAGFWFFVVCALYYIGAIVLITLWYSLTRQSSYYVAMMPLLHILPVAAGITLQWRFPGVPGTGMGMTFTFIVLFSNYQTVMVRRRLQDKNTDLENSMHRYQESFRIIEALSGKYESIYYADILSSSYQTLRTSEIFLSGVPSGGSLQDFSRGIVSLASPDSREAVEAFMNMADLPDRLRDRDFLTAEYEDRSGDWFQANWIIVDRDRLSSPRNMLCCFTDVTAEVRERQRRQAELEQALADAEKADRAKTQFLNNMSHDIRTPMNAILGYAHLMQDSLNAPAQLKDYLQKQERAGTFLLSLINDVLDMSRIESGKAQLEERYGVAGDIIRDIVNIYDREARENGLKVIHTVDIRHNRILLDVTKVRQIFSNLISNAIKYTPSGGTITIRTRELPPAREGHVTICTEVEDTGIGMSPEFLPILFDSFTRERNTTMAAVAGTGLGMSIVKKLVDLMGGSIEVKSTPGVGSSFAVTLSHPMAGSGEGPEDGAAALPAVSFAGRRILLAEDNDMNAEIAAVILENAGFLTDRAADGADCLDRLTHAPAGTYDLILMDIQMPNMDGYEATDAIRSLPDPALAGIPILAMTANAFEEDRRRALEAGMNGHLTKPIDVSALRAALAQVLQEHSRK